MVDEPVPLIKKLDQLLAEARVILPGAQALLGFQLAVVLTRGFEGLPAHSKVLHGAALGFVGLCTILLMAPAAYHRMVCAGEASQEFHQLGSRLIVAATIALALGLSGDVYVVVERIGGEMVGLAAAIISLSLLTLLWHVSPIVLRSLHSRASQKATSGVAEVGADQD